MKFKTVRSSGTAKTSREPGVKFYADRDVFQFNTAARRLLPTRVLIQFTDDGYLFVSEHEGAASRGIEQMQGILSLRGTRDETGWTGVKRWTLEPYEDGWLGKPLEMDPTW